MATKQYGKIINGQLMRAPLQINDNGNMYCGVPDNVYRKYGYKPLVFASQPESIPCGSHPVFVWKENNETIEQVWSLENLSDDYAEQLRKNKGRFNITLLRLKDGIRDYREQKNEKMLTVIHQDTIIEKAYENLKSKSNCTNIADAMKKYQKSIPCNFLEETGISDYLRGNGFVINTSNELLFFYDQNSVFTAQHSELLDFYEGKVYVKNTKRVLYPVPGFAAIKFSEAEPPRIIDPMMLFFTLQQIAEIYESFNCPNLYFTMAFIYLHTIMDDFITSLIRFYICTFPDGAEISKSISSVDILSVNSMDDLAELKNSIIDEKVSSLGHNSYQNKVKFLTKRGLNFTIDKTAWYDDMILFCEKRNAIVHNASLVNYTIIRKLAETSHKKALALGDDVSPDYDTLMAAITLVETVCNDIYNVAKAKFKF